MAKKKKSGAKERAAVVWAVDPFEKDTLPSEASLAALGDWAAAEGAYLKPVHIAAISDLDAERGNFGGLASAQARLRDFLRGLEMPGVGDGEVLVNEGGTQAAAVGRLLKYARAEKASWIAVSSHGRSGMGRMLFGSFAESLLRESPLPVLILDRREKGEALRAGRPTALFPTDFSSSSRKAFRRFLRHARPLGFHVVLFHAIGLPMTLYPPGLTSAYIPENYVGDEKESARHEAKQWIAEAARLGVEARFSLKDNGLDPVTGEAVLKAAAREGAALIAMVSSSGTLDRVMLGSAAYEVFRAGRYPVWMYGPASLGGPLQRPKARAGRAGKSAAARRAVPGRGKKKESGGTASRSR